MHSSFQNAHKTLHTTFLPVPEAEVVMEVVVTVTTPGMEGLWAMPGEPGMMMDVLVAPLCDVDVDVDALITGTDMDRWYMVDVDDWLELVTRITYA